MKQIINLLSNIRFYILVSTVLITVIVIGVLQTIIPNQNLYYIRLGQTFGLLALIYWYASLLLTPLSKLLEKRPWLATLLFARRAIGVSAAYFAFLHVLIAITKQMGGLSGLFGLPGRFTLALVLGGIGLVILLAMAATSLDTVVKRMTYKRWKWLQRTGYIAGILVILHIWMIGSHVDFLSWQLSAFLALVLLFGLEALRISKQLAVKYSELAPKDIVTTMAITLWVVLSGLLFILPGLIPQHHTGNNDHTTNQEKRHE